MNKSAIALGCLACLGLHTAASASGGADATIDLDTLSITGGTESGASSFANTVAGGSSDFSSNPGAHVPLFSSASDSGTSAFGTFIPGSTASSSISLGITPLPASPGPVASSNVYDQIGFSLLANQSATISFNYTLAQATGPLPAGGSFADYVYASFGGISNSGTTISLAFAPGTANSQTGTLLYTVTNTTGGTLSDYLYIGAATYEYVQSVPEPSEWALMSAGLAMLGFTAWRRGRTGFASSPLQQAAT